MCLVIHAPIIIHPPLFCKPTPPCRRGKHGTYNHTQFQMPYKTHFWQTLLFHHIYFYLCEPSRRTPFYHASPLWRGKGESEHRTFHSLLLYNDRMFRPLCAVGGRCKDVVCISLLRNWVGTQMLRIFCCSVDVGSYHFFLGKE